MPRLIIHDPPLSHEEIDELRLKRNLELTPIERINIALQLMEFALRFKKEPINQFSEKAIILRKRK